LKIANHTSQIKTKSLIGVRNIFLIIGAVLLFIAPFIHIEFSKKNFVVEDYKIEKEKQIITPVKKTLTTLKQNYSKGSIIAEDYILEYDRLNVELEKAKTKYNELVRSKENEERVLGWLTIRSFLIGFGIRLPYLLFSLIISYLISIINTKDVSLKRTFTFLQMVCYTISGYVLIWCFWYSQDYPLSSYRLIAIVISALVSLSLYFFIKYIRDSLVKKLERLKYIIRNLFDFILMDSKEQDFVKEDKKVYYRNKSRELIKEALDNE